MSRPLVQKTLALVHLARLLNAVMLAAGVFLGGWLAAGPAAFGGPAGLELAAAALAALLIASAGNALNDVYDLEADRINRPTRPLPAGAVTPYAAWMLWAGGSLGGLALSLSVSGLHAGLAAGAALLLYLYNARLKRTPAVGNVVVASLVALALFFGGLAVGPAEPVLPAATFAFLTTLAREIVKDVEDAEGDRAAAARTLPLAYGVRPALRGTALILSATVALTPAPFLLLDYSGLYLLIVLVAAGLLLGALWHLQGPAQASRASRLLKGAMALGMFALAVS